MSENLNLVRSIYATWERRGYRQESERMLADFDTDVVLDWSCSDAPDRGVYHGHAALRGFLRSRGEAFEGRRVDIDELIDAPPDRVVVVGRWRGQGKASGVEVEARTVTVWTLREGKATRLKLYRTRGEALKVVGLQG